MKQCILLHTFMLFIFILSPNAQAMIDECPAPTSGDPHYFYSTWTIQCQQQIKENPIDKSREELAVFSYYLNEHLNIQKNKEPLLNGAVSLIDIMDEQG